MPTHDIIDNREEILLDHVKALLRDSEKAKFAVGYLFVSGLTPIIEEIKNLNEIKLVVGPYSSRETIEQIVEAHKVIEQAKKTLEKRNLMTPSAKTRAVIEAKKKVRESLSLMEQTDSSEQLLKILKDLIANNKLKVRVYVKGRFHAKAYIFDYPEGRHDRGSAIVGSSNLSLGGLTDNTELNAILAGNANHAKLTDWFENQIWNEAEDFREELMEELNISWALNQPKPYDIYIKTLYNLLKDRLEEEEARELIWEREMPPLTDFQMIAVKQALQILKDYNGVFIGDVVGTGKTYIGVALLKHFRLLGARPLVICPPTLLPMWKDITEEYDINAKLLSSGELSQGTVNLQADKRFTDIDVVLIDESHYFRYSDTNRYSALQPYLLGKKVILVTATPRNTSIWDIYHQIKLFHYEEETRIPVEPMNLREFFKEAEVGNRRIQDLLRHILIRRTRKHILDHYGEWDEKGRKFIPIGGIAYYFPERELETWDYSIDKTYAGLYDEILAHIQNLSFAKYGLWDFVKPEFKDKKPYIELEKAGRNLRGLMKVLLFKRLESSVKAFYSTTDKLVRIHELFLKALEEGLLPVGEEAETLIYEAESDDEALILEQLDRMERRYDAQAFDMATLKENICNDVRELKELRDIVKDVTPIADDKLRRLKNELNKPELRETKVLIFTQYADTAEYLYENLASKKSSANIDIATSREKNRFSAIRRFAPQSNHYTLKPGEKEIRILISTDILSEGINLQDASHVINYDIHWNPVRLIQRVGRLDRIKPTFDVVKAYNFLPERELEKKLHLLEKVRARIAEFHRTIGADVPFLEKSEQINEEAMYAIYEKRAEKLSIFEEEIDPLSKDLFGLSEAEELLRNLMKNDPTYFEYIKNLPDGVRSAKASTEKVRFIFCDGDDYQKLYLINPHGEVIETDTLRVLNTIKCEQNEPTAKVPCNHNTLITHTFSTFKRELEERRARLKAISTIKPSQRYVFNHLQHLYNSTDDKTTRTDIERLKDAYKGGLPLIVIKQLNSLRRNGITRTELLGKLKQIYFQYGLFKYEELERGEVSLAPPKVICSMALV